jgi:iron(III) transport system permease protein
VAAGSGWFFVAAGRAFRKLGSLMDFVSIVMVLIPGPIVGVTIVLFFQRDVPGFRYLYHQSLLPLVMGLLVRALPVSYWMMRARYRGLGENVLDAARLEMSWWQRLWCIDRKLVTHTLLAAFVGAAIVASGDVPVMLPIIPPGVTMVGTRLFEQLHSGARYQEASLAFWYVCAVVVFACLLVRLASKRRVS